VKEDCAPLKKYIGHKGFRDSCKGYAKCEPYAKPISTYFIGRGYGDSTEKAMMKEILRNGVVAAEMFTPWF